MRALQEVRTPNDLRRTFASWLKQSGQDSLVVARLMGHTSTRMVELVYGYQQPKPRGDTWGGCSDFGCSRLFFVVRRLF